MLFKQFLRAIKSFLLSLHKGYIDFFYFPFNPNNPLPDDAFTEHFLPVISILNRLKSRYFVTDGTLLGLYRDQKLIAHDNDIDIAIASTAHLASLIFHLTLDGWRPGRILFSLREFRLVQLVFHRKECVLDFCIWKLQQHHAVLSVPEVAGIRVQNSYYYHSESYLTLHNFTFSTHPDPEQWILEHYGEDWCIPKTAKGDWRDDTHDIAQHL